MKNYIDMNGKIVMITGANSGIGKETAVELAKMGATVIIVCRNKDRGEEALKEIKERANSEKVELFLADLANQTSIRSMVKDFKKKHDKLHVLINNAGVWLRKRYTTSEGYEKTVAVNHLGHFLLTYLLLDILKASRPARIINVSSQAHKFAKLDLDDIHMKNDYRGFRAYGNSKLENLLFTYELAKKLENTGITVNALHPGSVRTNFGRNNSGKLFKTVFNFFRLFLISAKKGARTSIYLASSPEVEDITGKYFIKRKLRKSSKASYNKEFQKKLWHISENLTHVSYNKYLDLETVETLLVEKAMSRS